LSATLHSLPIANGSAPGAQPLGRELSAARIALSTASRQLRDELEFLEQLQRPADRLARIAQELSSATTELDQLRAFDDQAYGHWLAAGQLGERPQPDMQTLHAAARVRVLQHDHNAAETVRGAAEAAYAAQAAKVAECQRARDEALCLAIADAAADFVRTVWTPQLTDALLSQAVLQGLVDELREMSGHNPDAASAAAQVSQMLTAAKRAIGVPQDRTPARRLVEALYTNPGAHLEAP
jgi:hypothetical protein